MKRNWRSTASLLAFLFLMLASWSGCSDGDLSRFNAIGTKHRITLYSGGDAVRAWTSTGKVSNESESDGYYFRDDATGKLVRVSGDVVIESQ